MRIKLAALAIALAFSAFSQPSAGIQKGAPVEGITEYTLPNGLRVLLFPDPSNPKVTVNVTYLVGSRRRLRRDRHGSPAGALAIHSDHHRQVDQEGTDRTRGILERQHV